mmetsp:Transcript_1266/g.2740  ORF Transcript_1266/g.2740 Transcript_1266/m.2740 type:complete len:258 (-) Transcript_1266:1682-2455(-)
MRTILDNKKLPEPLLDEGLEDSVGRGALADIPRTDFHDPPDAEIQLNVCLGTLHAPHQHRTPHQPNHPHVPLLAFRHHRVRVVISLQDFLDKLYSVSLSHYERSFGLAPSHLHHHIVCCEPPELLVDAAIWQERVVVELAHERSHRGSQPIAKHLGRHGAQHQRRRHSHTSPQFTKEGSQRQSHTLEPTEGRHDPQERIKAYVHRRVHVDAQNLAHAPPPRTPYQDEMNKGARRRSAPDGKDRQDVVDCSVDKEGPW